MSPSPATKVYVNTASEERVWPSLKAPDGSTLQLKGGESVELALPDDFEDTFLKPKVVPAPVAPRPVTRPEVGGDKGDE